MNYDARIDTAGAEPETSGFEALHETSEQEAGSRRRMWIIAVLALLALVGVWFLTHRSDADTAAADRASQAPLVSVVVPAKVTVASEVSTNGSLAARRELPVGVAGEGGQIVRVLVEPGDWVRTGQVLAIVDRSVQTSVRGESVRGDDTTRVDGTGRGSLRYEIDAVTGDVDSGSGTAILDLVVRGLLRSERARQSSAVLIARRFP